MKRYLIALVAMLTQLFSAPCVVPLTKMARRIRRRLGIPGPQECRWRADGMPLVAGGATDTVQFGQVEKFEDFLVTAIADLPEIDTQAVTGDTVAVVAGGKDGRLRHSISTSDDDDVGATTFGALNWTAGVDLRMEARFFLSSITDNKFFVGFGDSIATADETTFSATTDTVTIDTQSDAFGILFDNDATTKNLWCVAGKTDAVTVSQVLNSKYNPVAATAITLGCFCSADRKVMEFYVNGETVYRIDSATTLIAAVALVPGVWNYEQGTAYNCDLDYLYACNPRSTT